MARSQGADRRFKILSLCGGGYMGLYTAKILARIEEPLLTREDKAAGRGRLHERLDLVAGTSIGGLLALGVVYGIPAATLADALQTHGKNVFPRRGRFRRVVGAPFRAAYNLIAARYSQGPLADAIDAVLGHDRPLSQVRTRALVPAVELANGTAKVFHAEPGIALHKTAQGKEVSARQVALATAAAPVFLPAARIDGLAYADGGLVANAPDTLAVARACALGFPLDRVRVLSIGTTSERHGIPAAAGDNLGLWPWVRNMRILKIAMAGQMDLSRQVSAQLLGDIDHVRRHKVIDIAPTAEVSSMLGLDRADEAADAEIDQLVAATADRIDLDRVSRDWFQSA